MILLNFAIGFLTFVQVFGVELECEIKTGYYIKSECIVKNSFKTTEPITGIRPKGGPTDKISLLSFREINSSSFPSNICAFLPNIETINISGETITDLGSRAFAKCSKVTKIEIVTTKIYWLSENLLDEVPKLKEFSIIYSKIKLLPMNLIANNHELRTFLATENEIEQIDIQFGLNIKSINLINNTCINKTAGDPGTVENLNREIAKNCSSSKQKSMQKVIDQQSNLSNNIKLELDDCKGESKMISFVILSDRNIESSMELSEILFTLCDQLEKISIFTT